MKVSEQTLPSALAFAVQPLVIFHRVISKFDSMQHLLFLEPNHPNSRPCSPYLHLSMYREIILEFSFAGLLAFSNAPTRTRETHNACHRPGDHAVSVGTTAVCLY